MPDTLEVKRLFRWTATPRRQSSPARAELLDALHAHAGLMIACAARVLGNAADAEDVAQDIVESLLRKPPVKVTHWPALLKTMAVNRAIDLLRKRRDVTDTDELLAVDAQPDEALSARQRAAALRAAIARLEPHQAALFSLCYFADLSHAAIARETGMTGNAVGVALHRIRKLLADDIRGQLDIPASGDLPS